MAYRTLDLTVVSAKDLKRVTFLSPMRVYAVVSLPADHPRSTRRTPTDRDGHRNLTWNTPLRFTIPTDMDISRTSLSISLHTERLLGDRLIGEVRIAIRDLISGEEARPLQHVSYQVRRPFTGKPKGVLNISYQVSGPIAPNTSNSTILKGNDEPVLAYPATTTSHSVYGAMPPPSYPMTNVYPPVYQQAPPPYGYPPPNGYSMGYGYGPGIMHEHGHHGYHGYGDHHHHHHHHGHGNGNFGVGLGAGLLGGALGGMLVGEMIDDEF